MQISKDLYEITFITILMVYAGHINSQEESCGTANRPNGTCMILDNCAVLQQLFVTRGREPSVAALLRRSHCGFEEKTPKVCCPTRNNTGRTRTNSTNYSDCGLNNGGIPRIVNGRPAELGAWPWMAAIGFRSGSRTHYGCGGTLISNRHVITAAHCVTNLGGLQLSTVRLGDLNLDPTQDDKATPIDIPIDRAVAHPQHSLDPIQNDIAIIKLRQPVQFQVYIRPVCIPTRNMRSETYAGKNSIIAGWGTTAYRGPRSQVLLQALVRNFNNSECKMNYRNSEKAIIDNRIICAGGNGSDACQGDSGGPLMTIVGSRFYLIGIVSYGAVCGDATHPGVYTRVTEFLDWIGNNLI